MKKYDRPPSLHHPHRGYSFSQLSRFSSAILLSPILLSAVALNVASCSLESMNLSTLSGDLLPSRPTVPKEEKSVELQNEADSKTNSELNGKQLADDDKKEWFGEGCLRVTTRNDNYPIEYIGFSRLSSPAYGEILGVGKQGSVSTWERLGGHQEFYEVNRGTPITASALHETSSLLALAEPESVRIISLETCKTAFELTSLRTRFSSIAFQPDGSSLLLGAADGKVYRWRFKDEQNSQTRLERDRTLERYFGHGTVISAVVFHPLGRIFFSGDWDGRMNAWLPYDSDRFGGEYDRNISDQRLFSEQAMRMRADRGSGESLDKIILSKDGELIVLATQDGFIELWRVRGFKKIAGIQAHRGVIYDLALSDDGTRIVSSGRDGKVIVWKVTVPEDTALSEIPKDIIVAEREKLGLDLRRILFLSRDLIGGATVGGKIESIALNSLPPAVAVTPKPQTGAEIF